MAESKNSNWLGIQVIAGFIGVFLATWFIVLVLGVGINQVMKRLAATPNVRIFVGCTLSRGGMLVAVLWLSAFALCKVMKLCAREVMFPLHSGWWKDLVFGCMLATVVMVVLFVIEVAAGWLVKEGWRLQGEPVDAWLRTVWLSVLVNLLAAVGEETMYRGYLLTGLSRVWGKRVGLGVMAILFALSHITVTGAEETNWVLFVFLLALPGLVLGWTYLWAGSLWLPIGIHFAWNLLQDDLLNLPGDRVGDSLFGIVTHQQGPEWIVGTSYGMEVGLVGGLALMLITFGVWFWTCRRNRQS